MEHFFCMDLPFDLYSNCNFFLSIFPFPQDKDKKKEETPLPCGEWNNDFVQQLGETANDAEARNHANQVLDDVNRNVVMLD